MNITTQTILAAAIMLGTIGRLDAQVIAVGGSHTGAILADGTVKVWGFNSDGQLGQGHSGSQGDDTKEMGDNLPPVSLGSGRTATSIACGKSHTAVILDNGTVKAWGHNGFGQLGLGNNTTLGDQAGEMGDALPTVDLGTGRTATAIACGQFVTAVILDNGTVKIWGANSSGQLGQGNTTSLGGSTGEMGDDLLAVNLGAGRTATAIACGNNHTAVVLDNGAIKVWGRNSYGQLGQGHTDILGDEADEMGDFLATVNLGSGRTAIAIDCGEGHTAVILDNGTVKVWGKNTNGELGLGHTNDLGDGSNEMGEFLTTVDLGSGRTATAITCGEGYTAVMLDNGEVKVWGYNAYGQLGQGHTNNLGDGASEMGNNLIAVDLGTGLTGDQLAHGNYSLHTAVRLNNGKIKVWGLNGNGQLGQGHTNNLGDDSNEMGNVLAVVNLSNSSDVSLPVELTSFTASVTRNGTVALKWTTESEMKNLGFIIDRRTKAGEWLEIGNYATDSELQGQGSVTYQTEYFYTDITVEEGVIYDYRIADVSYQGDKEYHRLSILGFLVTMPNPETFRFSPAYPNPFNPTTTIRYRIPEAKVVSIKIYDMRGREVRELVRSFQAAGRHEVTWNGMNSSNSQVSTGIYYARFNSGEYSKAIKMLYLN